MDEQEVTGEATSEAVPQATDNASEDKTNNNSEGTPDAEQVKSSEQVLQNSPEEDAVETEADAGKTLSDNGKTPANAGAEESADSSSLPSTSQDNNKSEGAAAGASLLDEEIDDENDDNVDNIDAVEAATTTTTTGSQNDPVEQQQDKAEKLRIMEEMHIGPATEILFPQSDTSAALDSNNAWDNLRWMSLSGSRRIGFSRVVFERTRDQSVILGIKSNISISFPARLLVLYQHPQVLLLLRRAVDLQELSRYTEIDFNDVLSNNSEEQASHLLKHYWIAETALDLATCQLQLSAITTHYASKVIGKIRNEREVSCFAVRSPTVEQIFLSSVQIRPDTKSKQELSYTDSVAFVETSTTETAITDAICQAQVLTAHEEARDLTWKHQLITGTLFSFVLSGNTKALEEALDRMWSHLNPSSRQGGKDQDVTSPTELKNAFDGAWRKLSSTIDPSSSDKDEKKEAAKQQQRILPDNIINAVDGHGYPPIFYACSQRMNEAVALLIRYGASIDFSAKATGETLLHVCARNLNANGLKLLLQVRDRPGVHINAINSSGESPLYVAVVHGRGNDLQLDPEALDQCIDLLKANGGRLFTTMSSAYKLEHPLVSLGLNYRKDDLAVLMEHLSLEYPLSGIMDVVSKKSHIVVSRTAEESLAAFFSYPLHRVLAKFDTDIKLGVVPKKDEVVGTIRLLLQKGFEANERIELEDSEEDEDLLEFAGFSPLQMLSTTAIELEAMGPTLNESTYGELDSILSTLAEELVRTGGARISLDAPVNRQRPRKQVQKSSSNVSSESKQRSETTSSIDRSTLKIDSNEHLMHLLGGKARLEKAQASFAELGKVMIDATRAPRRDDSSNIEDNVARGGNNEKSCAICWKGFSLLSRKHRCRVSWRHICEECSTKRFIVNGKDYRISDGQYVCAKVTIENPLTWKAVVHPPATAPATTNSSTNVSPDEMSRVRRQRLQAEEKANRESLFGGAMEKATSFLFGDDEQEKQQQQQRSSSETQQMSGLMNSLGETRNALLERGDKLSSLSEKSEKMVSASEDFAKMATDLRKQSERGLFW